MHDAPDLGPPLQFVGRWNTTVYKAPHVAKGQYCSARNLHEIPNLFLFIDLHKGIGERHMAKSRHNRKP